MRSLPSCAPCSCFVRHSTAYRVCHNLIMGATQLSQPAPKQATTWCEVDHRVVTKVIFSCDRQERKHHCTTSPKLKKKLKRLTTYAKTAADVAYFSSITSSKSRSISIVAPAMYLISQPIRTRSPFTR